MTITPIPFLAFEIRDVPDLDPIRVFLQDFGSGQGRLIVVECYGQAWSNFWPAMGATLRQFISEVDPDYIATCLIRGVRHHNKRDYQYLHRIATAIKAAMGNLPVEITAQTP